MPNQPAQSTVMISFTLPRRLDQAVEAEAATKMTNKSDIIRRALMDWIPPEERKAVEDEIAASSAKSREASSKAARSVRRNHKTPPE